jgi:glycosyltransferase involved in cell wall biosynthesis
MNDKYTKIPFGTRVHNAKVQTKSSQSTHNRKLTIVYASDAIFPFTIGGSELRNYHILKRLAQEGHDVHIYGAKYWDGNDTLLQEGIQIHGIYPYSQLYKNGKRSKRAQIQYSLILGWKLLFKKFDIVESPSFLFANCFILRLITWAKGKKLILIWHQYLGDYVIGYLGKRVGFIVRFLEFCTTLLAKNNIVISQKVSRDLQKRHFLPYQRVVCIPNGVDLESIQKVKKALCTNAKKIHKKYDIIFVGRIHYQKNIPLFLDVIEEVKKAIPNIRVCMVGPIQMSDFFSQITVRKLKSNIIYHKETSDQEEIYKQYFASKVLLLTSHMEGFPLTLLEANACGVPVVCVENVHTQFDSYLDEKLKVPMDAKKIAEKIIWLLHSQKEYARLSFNAKERAAEFDWNKTTQSTLKFYEKISF